MQEPWPVVVTIRRRTVLKRPLTVLLAVGLVALAAASTFPYFASASATASAPVATRVAGANRYETAAALSQRSFKPGVPTVYVANGATYPDAIAAGTAAAHDGGPLLLATANAVPSSTRREIARLAPKRIVVLGGSAAIGETVAQQLGAISKSTVVRRAGADRYATAAAISAAAFPARPPVAYVVSGNGFADGLTASAAAAGAGPVLLVTPTAVPTSVATELRRLRPARIVVIGGTTSVNNAVLSKLRSLTGAAVSRISGKDRYSTAAKVASTNPNSSRVYVASGAGFSDALAASATAARDHASLILVPPDTVVGPGITAFAAGQPSTVIAVGGRSVVSENQVRVFGLPSGSKIPPVSTDVPKVIAAARAQLGKPYLWAADGPDSFDCSGLTLFAWATAGVELSHFSGAQFDQLPHIPIGLRQPGDLIFYGDPIHHVGLYIGDDQMIEAQETGTNVRIGSIWRNDTYGVGRPG